MGLNMFAVLLVCVCLAAGSPLHLLPPHKEITRGSYIRHYSIAKYDTASLREHRARSRRDISAPHKEPPLILHIQALDRVFRMRLIRDNTLFASDAVFEGTGGRSIAFDTTHVYTGTLDDDENALVHGVLTEDGLFDGAVSTASGEIYIEPAGRYSIETSTTSFPYHTIAYRSTDVETPGVQGNPCHSHKLRQDGTPNFTHAINEARHGYQPHASQPLYQHLNDGRTHAKPGFYPKDARKKEPTASSHNLELLDKLYRERYSRVLRKRTSVDPRKTTCMLYLQADYTFFSHYKSEEACIEVMTRHVQRVNAIYRKSDFNQDGQPDNISFMIKRVKVYGDGALQDPTYRFTGSYGVEEFLELFSEEDYDAFCLSYMFTYRDFEKGTLGLAWTGDLKNAGGVCEKNGHYRGSMKSLNTGIVTLLNYGKHVPPAVSHVTLAHEIGHNFGSPHDPNECSPGGEDGNFIMFARATSGDKRNNNRFSPCSLLAINPIINAKGRSTKGCFTEHQAAICGNGVVERGEQCDCGWEEDCNDPCCHPQRRHHHPHEVPCRLTEGAICSPSQGPCCTSGCTLRSGDKCRDDNGCRDASFCDGRTPQCPQSINKPNKTICNQEFVCYMGECTGSICLAYGLESCQCMAGPGDPPTKSCELCCKLPGENRPCLSSFSWNSAPYDIPDMLSKPGTPCNDYNGYCDVFQRCREVDPSGPLATLRRLLLSDASLATFQQWMTEHWYVVGVLAMALLSMLVAITRLLGKHASSRLKKLTTTDSSPSAGTQNSSEEKSVHDNSRYSAMAKNSGISMDRIRKKVVETMKAITSPQRKKDLSSDFHVSKFMSFLPKGKLENELRVDNEHSQILREGNVSERSGNVRDENVRAVLTSHALPSVNMVENDASRDLPFKEQQSLCDENMRICMVPKNIQSRKSRRKRYALYSKSHEANDSRRLGVSDWLSGFGRRNFHRSKSSPVRTKFDGIPTKTLWNVGFKFLRVEQLCSSPTLRSNKLPEPNSPESPSDLPEPQVLTSDLVVLLQES